MKNLFFMLGFGIGFKSSFAQLNQIPASKFYEQNVRQVVCIDSTGKVTKFCPLELYSFKIKIFKAYVDTQKKELRLIGRLFLSDTVNGPGIPGVEIFKAVKVNGKFMNRMFLGETTKEGKSSNDDGFFDVKFSVGAQTNLCFFTTPHLNWKSLS